MKATSIRLTERRETALAQTAERLKCFSSSGNPSWRVMLQMIADGFLTISNPNDKSRKVFINFKRPPGWWKPDEDGAMPAALVAKNYKTTVEILEEKDFILDGDRIFPGNWKGWQPKAEEKVKVSAAKQTDSLELAESTLPEVKPLQLTAPPWFVRLPGMTAMPLADAIKASAMDEATMKLHGIRVRKISGNRYVTGPTGSEWDLDTDDGGES